MTGTARVIRVFLASPGDVGEERKFVIDLLDRVLPNDGWKPGEVVFKVIGWDHDLNGTPMLATMSPQKAVETVSGKPSDCDIVIVILWSRMGTHLDIADYPRADGSRYESGTEWEYEDAFNAEPRPDILVYHRTERPVVDLDASDLDEKRRQRGLVTGFLGRFKNADGAFTGMSNPYTDVGEFKTKITSHLKQVIARRLGGGSSPTVTTAPDPSPTPIPPPDRCVGRDPDVAEIVAALSAGGHVLVTGEGGIGKTTLTQESARHPDLAARFADRRWFVELETATDRDTFDAQVLAALGLDRPRASPPRRSGSGRRTSCSCSIIWKPPGAAQAPRSRLGCATSPPFPPSRCWQASEGRSISAASAGRCATGWRRWRTTKPASCS